MKASKGQNALIRNDKCFLLPTHSQARTPSCGALFLKVLPRCTLHIAQPQQILAPRLERDAHIAFAMALVGAIVFA
jgi:hypothetical protein